MAAVIGAEFANGIKGDQGGYTGDDGGHHSNGSTGGHAGGPGIIPYDRSRAVDNVGYRAAPIPMGIFVSVLMGMVLTPPKQGAALAIMLELGGLAAGAATVGCSTQMVGFAVASYRGNGWGGLISLQGLGTSMLQGAQYCEKSPDMDSPTLASAIIGPFATTLFRMENIPMERDGYQRPGGSVRDGGGYGDKRCRFWKDAAFAYRRTGGIDPVISEYMRKIGWIKAGDMKLPE